MKNSILTIHIITIFPEIFLPLKTSIIKRAQDKKLVNINIVNLRDFTTDKHKTVDDAPYGGGSGMVLKVEPVYKAIKKIKRNRSCKVILMSPKGITFNQNKARTLLKEKNIILICGHYEGFDERILHYVDEELSIGDYILTQGELPAMVIADSVIRLIPGVIDKESVENESFNNSLLDYPHYTRPAVFRKMKVPEVLLSGNHKLIKKYRLEKQLEITKKLRPDLYRIYKESL